ncbi:MAG: Nif11-like leader peptide family RiPP precursor [Marinobacter sp.]
MKTEELRRFIDHIEQDEAFSAQLQSAVSGLEGEEAIERILTFSQSHGYQLDRETIIETGRLANANSDELDDAQLDQAAGGILEAHSDYIPPLPPGFRGIFGKTTR